ncbi:hypothetical protein BGZ51_008413 [Haplosporangium sp. Z 767]|nr:hypothetical protein BGZ51_008413 [Haplosporangium sp. Z 767]
MTTTNGNSNNSNNSNNKQSYSSYHRAKRNARLQQQQQRDHHEWMFGISDEDDLHIDSESGSWTARASPVDSPISPPSSSSAASSGSSMMRHGSTRSQFGHVADVFQSEPLQPKKKRSMVTFSPVILHHSTPSGEQHSIPSPANVMPSISESTLARNSTTATITTLATSASATSAIVNQQQPRSGTGRLTAKESLMRITQCDKSQDGWCPQGAGQYTQRYAEARPRAMMLDGRRRGRH